VENETMEMKSKTKNRRNLNRTRQRILDAAAREFAEHGLPGARVDAIARRARANKAMIYYIFGGKEQLHLAVLEELFEEKTRGLNERMELEPMAWPDFLAMLKNYFETFVERREYAQLMLHDIATGGQALRRLQKKRPELFEVFGRLSDAVRAAMRQGILREMDADKGVMMLLLIIASLACMLPHMDLARLPGSAARQNLSDPGQWQLFLAEVLQRIVLRQPA
jgi:TetR/AcrR family transcriptional regulator